MGMCLPVIELLSPTEIPCLCEYGGGGGWLFGRGSGSGVSHSCYLPAVPSSLWKSVYHSWAVRLGQIEQHGNYPQGVQGPSTVSRVHMIWWNCLGKRKQKKEKKKKEYLCPSLSLRLLAISRQSGYGDLWCLPRMQQQHWRYLLL